MAYQRVHIAFREWPFWKQPPLQSAPLCMPLRERIPFGCLTAWAKQAWNVCGGVCAKAWGENEIEKPTHQRLRVLI